MRSDRTGTVIAGFRIQSVIGQGAMGTVYLADDASEEGSVALKLLAPELARDERFRQRFLRESQLAASLRHPHIVPVRASGEAEGVWYLAMAYIEGTDLRELLQREGRLEPERALDLVGQAADALDAAHAAGLVHRDVKPGNILVAGAPGGEHAYICDFGLARHVSSVSSLTGDRGFVGTIDYVPPEQIEGGPIDLRADVYSLGCVLYECLAGERPFDRETELSVVFAHLNEPPPGLTDLRPELPEAFDRVFATALAKAPGDRYSTCGELVEAARAAREGKVLVRPRWQRRRLLAVLAVLATAGAASIGAFVATRGTDTAPVSISPAAIAGGRLGLSRFDYERIWGPGWRKASLDTPAGYSILTNGARQVTAYFTGSSDKAVEITTWNKADRTAAGVGPCSTVAELKAAYGSRLRPVKDNIHESKVYGYTVGKNLFFAIELDLEHVQSVALYANPLRWAGYNALSEGPCSTGKFQARPGAPPSTAALDRPVTYTTDSFLRGMQVTVPTGRWRLSVDDRGVLSLASPDGPPPDGTQINGFLDPFASGQGGRDRPAGAPLTGVGRTPAALIAWLRRRPTLVASTPTARRIAHGRLRATSVDLDLSVRAPREDPGCPGPCLTWLAFRGHGYAFGYGTGLGEPVRLYLTTVRIGADVHTLAFAVDSPSAKVFKAVVPTAEKILSSVTLPATVSPR
jgi:tRNA A-37 threonylcarbamoyl transferase component Bud32